MDGKRAHGRCLASLACWEKQVSSTSSHQVQMDHDSPTGSGGTRHSGQMCMGLWKGIPYTAGGDERGQSLQTTLWLVPSIDYNIRQHVGTCCIPELVVYGVITMAWHDGKVKIMEPVKRTVAYEREE